MGWFVKGGDNVTMTRSTGSGSQQEQSSTRRLGVNDEQYVRQLLRQFGDSTTPDLKKARTNAIADSAGAIDQIMQQYKDVAIPEILTKQQQSGGYGGTTTQMLANDAGSRAVAQGAALRLQAINNYETTELDRSKTALGGLSTSLNALLAAQEQSSKSGTYSTKSASDSWTHWASAGGGMG